MRSAGGASRRSKWKEDSVGTGGDETRGMEDEEGKWTELTDKHFPEVRALRSSYKLNGHIF